MCPSTKKRPKNRVAYKMQDEKLQDKKQPVSKLIERSRLRMVLKNLSLLKLLKSSNSRIQELHSLARRCWNSIIRIPKSPQISSGGNNVCKKVKQNNEELQEVRALGKKPEPKKAESVREPKGKTSKEWKPKKKPQGASTAVPQRKKHIKPKVLKMAKSHGLHTRAQKRKHHVKKPRVVFLKTYHHRTSPGDMKPLDTTDQLVWFEGLPTRVHLPGADHVQIFCPALYQARLHPLLLCVALSCLCARPPGGVTVDGKEPQV